MTHPKRADHFKKWAAMMLEQALVPERLEYKQASGTKSYKKRGKRASLRGRKRFLRRKRKKQD